jgi:FkbM family methyltransferase
MFNPVKFFTTPEYLFNPRQALQRLRRIWRPRQPVESLRLPWGAIVEAHTDENIGRMLYFYGIFDKVVPEAIFRLLDPGEVAVEIGANIGQNCSCMARRAWPGGMVYAFEPHPDILSELRRNVARWPADKFAPVHIEPVALSAEPGEASLENGPEFKTNRGSASIQRGASRPGSFTVKLARLDDCLCEVKDIGVCKIDVEGHELSVLQGATDLLKRRAIRDIIFEDFNPQPSDVTKLLRDNNYEVFKLSEGRLKPALQPLGVLRRNSKQDTHNFLATLDPQRTVARYQPIGWRCLMAG